MQIRSAEQADVEALAQLWWSGWHEAHAGLFADALVALRTLDNFRDRVRAGAPAIQVVGSLGAPVAFHLLKGDELNQFYVAADQRGTGLAAALMADAEARLARDYPEAWLVCAIGNLRAARFYEKSGWRRVGVVTFVTETSEGPYSAQVWRYEKALA